MNQPQHLLPITLHKNNMSNTQIEIEGIIPSIRSLTLESQQTSSKISELENQLSNLPEVKRLKEEIRNLQNELLKNQASENAFRERGKKLMMESNLQEFTMNDGTKVSLTYTAGALVVDPGAVIPDKYYNIKTVKDLDKVFLKKAMEKWEFEDEKVYLKKEAKFVIKHKE